MKNLNHPIEEKADLDQLGLVKIEHFNSSELDILIGHINRHVKNLHFYYPNECPYPGTFEYSIILKTYDIPENPYIHSFQIESTFYYKYKGNIKYNIVYSLDKTFVCYDSWRDSIINVFNYACFTKMIKEPLNDILFGTVILSNNPNHFLYNMTYRDTLKLTNNKQIELEL